VKNKICYLFCTFILLSSCSTSQESGPLSNQNDTRGIASQYAKVTDDFLGKDFFKELEGFSLASFFNQHDVATFFKWSLKNPIPFFELLRNEKPIFEINDILGAKKYMPEESKGLKTVIVTLNEDVRDVLSQSQIFSTRFYREKMDKSVGKFMLAHDNDKVNQEKAWMRTMLKREDLPMVRSTVNALTKKALLDSNVNGRIDVVNAVARRVPLELIENYFGFKGPDLRTMYRWSKYSQYSFFHNVVNKKHYEQKGIQVGQEMHDHLKKLMQQKRLDQSFMNEDTVLARLMKANIPEGEMLDFYDGRVRTNLIGSLVGGVETTQAAIVQVLEFLLSHPRILQKAQEAIAKGNQSLYERIVWEALRFRPVNTVLIRYAEKDYTLAADTSREYKVKKGQMVVASVISAMFDENFLEHPKNFRVDRPTIKEKNTPYLHFGFGHHKCLGDHIAEIMVPEILKELLLLPNVRLISGEIGQINYDDNITSFELDRDIAKSPFPESFVIEFDSKRQKNKVTLADPRFAFEDYLMDYDRVFYRKCLSNFESLSTFKNTFSPIFKNLKGQFTVREVEDLFICRLPETFHHCVKEAESHGSKLDYKAKYNLCKSKLSPNEDFFFQAEIFGKPLDLTKVPELDKAGMNTGFTFEEDLKFYDRDTFRMAHRNPMSASAFPVSDDLSAEEALFYTRLEWSFRTCIAKNALILRKPDELAYKRCMSSEKLKLDSLTDKYYQHIFFKKKWSDVFSDESSSDKLDD
jgi:cytochrome P450